MEPSEEKWEAFMVKFEAKCQELFADLRCIVRAPAPSPTPTTSAASNGTALLPDSATTNGAHGAQKVFDGMPGHQEANTGRVLRVTVSQVFYPVTKEVLHQVFDAYGAEKVCDLEVADRTEALVLFRSSNDAVRARDACHGRCIYDNSCWLDLQYVQPLPTNSTPVMPGKCSMPRLSHDAEKLKAASTPVAASTMPLTTSVAMATTSFAQKAEQPGACKVFNQGIKTMKKRENAVFTIPPDLAYGESGSPPTIPPNATLQFDVELLSWTSVKDNCKDGGIFKKILKEGEKWENPKDPDEVLVKYEARLEDGTVVSKSEGVEFTVKDGYFCPALAKAVKTMKKAEKVLLTVKPQYGFGEKGRPATGEEGAVPPNASLLVDLELVSWKTVTEIGDDKKILKKVLKEGEGYERPNEGAVVKVKITGTLQDGTLFFKKGHDEEPFEFKTDEEEVIDGLDHAVLNMKNGEVTLVTIPPEYAFGSTESKQDLAVVPPNSTVIHEVELVSFVKDKESWDLNNAEKVEAAGKKKEEGNALFKLGKYARAFKRYEKVAKYIEHDTSFSEDEKKQSKQLKITCNLNNAACKLEVLGSGVESASLLLKILSVHELQRPWDPGGQDIAIASVRGIKTKENAGHAPPNSTGVQAISRMQSSLILEFFIGSTGCMNLQEGCYRGL